MANKIVAHDTILHKSVLSTVLIIISISYRLWKCYSSIHCSYTDSPRIEADSQAQREQIDTELSYITFDNSDDGNKHKGIAFIVINNYRGAPGKELCEPEKALRDYGILDFNTVNRFFDNLVDKYHITIMHDVIRTRFIATCKYLADNTNRESSDCKRIIIYFSGHGDDSRILMENCTVSVKLPIFCLTLAIARIWKEYSYWMLPVAQKI